VIWRSILAHINGGLKKRLCSDKREACQKFINS